MSFLHFQCQSICVIYVREHVERIQRKEHKVEDADDVEKKSKREKRLCKKQNHHNSMPKLK